MRRALCATLLAAACLAAPSAQAADVLIYNETIGTNTVANTPHAQPAVYTDGSFSTDHSYVKSSITFSSTPAPYVLATAENWIDDLRYGNPSAGIGGSLLYQLAVHGAPNTVVPVGFDGFFSVSGTTLMSGTDVWPQTSATVSLTLGTSFFKIVCGNHACSETISGPGLSATDKDKSPALWDGWLNGSIGVALNSAGTGTLTVVLGANAGAHVGVLGTASATTFIDPKFYIDPLFLAANPGTMFALTPGVGNEVAAVPEVGSLGLMVLGLAGVGLRRRVSVRRVRGQG